MKNDEAWYRTAVGPSQSSEQRAAKQAAKRSRGMAAWQLLWARSRSTSTVVRVGMAFGEAIAALYILERQRAANEQI